MTSVLENFSKQEIWALSRAISGEVGRILQKPVMFGIQMSDDDKLLYETLVHLAPEINRAWELLQEQESKP